MVSVEQELLKRETEFCTYRNVTALIVSWNVDAARTKTVGLEDSIMLIREYLLKDTYEVSLSLHFCEICV